MGWDAETYVALERMLFDLDYVLRRMTGWSTRPRVPHETDAALARAWSLGLDMARILRDEKQRLTQAKVAHDRRQVGA